MSFVAFDARSVGVFNGALARSSRPLRSAMSISFSIWDCRLAWTHIGRLLAHAEKSLLLRPDLRSLRRNTVFLSRPPDRAQPPRFLQMAVRRRSASALAGATSRRP